MTRSRWLGVLQCAYTLDPPGQYVPGLNIMLGKYCLVSGPLGSNPGLGSRYPPRLAFSPTLALRRLRRSAPEANSYRVPHAPRGSSCRIRYVRSIKPTLVHKGGRTGPILSWNWVNSNVRSGGFKSDRRTEGVSNNDGGSVGLYRNIQLGRPIIPRSPFSVCHRGCSSNCGICPLKLLRRVFRDPESYVSILAAVVFTPVRVPIIDASITAIRRIFRIDVNATHLFSREVKERTCCGNGTHYSYGHHSNSRCPGVRRWYILSDPRFLGPLWSGVDSHLPSCCGLQRVTQGRFRRGNSQES